MGACASKPKGLNADMDAPEPVPEVVKEETATTTTTANVSEQPTTDKIEGGEETKEIVKKVEEEPSSAEAVKEEDDVDEKGAKHRSLNSLLNESNDGKDAAVSDKPTAVEEPKAEAIVPESSNADKPTPAIVLVETEKKPVEPVAAAEAVQSQKPEEKKPEEKAEEKKTEVKVEAVKDANVIAEKAPEAVASTVEVKPVVAETK